MPYYRRVGDIPRKRHTIHHLPDGVAYEELVGEGGFSSSSSLLYHLHSPSALRSIEACDLAEPHFEPNFPVTPYHFRPTTLAQHETDHVLGRRYLLGNGDVRIAWVRADQDSPLYRNARGDELTYVRTGSAVVESVFGRLEAATGDYVVMPAGVTHRWLVTEEIECLVVEASGHVGIPDRYLTPRGQLKEGAPFCERDHRAPAEPLLLEGEEVPVLVRTRSGLTRHVHARHPFDVVGWDGCLYPWAFSLFDFEPLVGRIHQPPPIHQTFAGTNFVVCSFVPRPFEFDPDAVKVPYHHANVDCDEVLFLRRRRFHEPDRIGNRTRLYHRAPLGLHPRAPTRQPERAAGSDRTDEVAVMIDTFAPLGISSSAHEVSDSEYPFTWAHPGGSGNDGG